MFEYYVYNTETGDELFSSSKISECRSFARSYSIENCIPCTISVIFRQESYVNGCKLYV